MKPFKNEIQPTIHKLAIPVTALSLINNFNELSCGWPREFDTLSTFNHNYELCDGENWDTTENLSYTGILNLAELITGINRLEYNISNEDVILEAMKAIRPVCEKNDFDTQWINAVFWRLMDGLEQATFYSG